MWMCQKCQSRVRRVTGAGVARRGHAAARGLAAARRAFHTVCKTKCDLSRRRVRDTALRSRPAPPLRTPGAPHPQPILFTDLPLGCYL